MVQIIKPGFLKEVQCQKCGAILRYDERTDVEKTVTDKILFNPDPYGTDSIYVIKHIICPQCKIKIILNEIK